MFDKVQINSYLLRAGYDWLLANDQVPYIMIEEKYAPDNMKHHCRNGFLTLNVNPSAIDDMFIGPESVSFSARFGGVKTDIVLPTNKILQIFSRDIPNMGIGLETVDEEPEEVQPPKARPTLSIVK